MASSLPKTNKRYLVFILLLISRICSDFHISTSSYEIKLNIKYHLSIITFSTVALQLFYFVVAYRCFYVSMAYSCRLKVVKKITFHVQFHYYYLHRKLFVFVYVIFIHLCGKCKPTSEVGQQFICADVYAYSL